MSPSTRCRGGPETLLRWLETQLGLPSPPVHIANRITEYATALDTVTPRGDHRQHADGSVGDRVRAPLAARRAAARRMGRRRPRHAPGHRPRPGARRRGTRLRLPLRSRPAPSGAPRLGRRPDAAAARVRTARCAGGMARRLAQRPRPAPHRRCPAAGTARSCRVPRLRPHSGSWAAGRSRRSPRTPRFATCARAATRRRSSSSLQPSHRPRRSCRRPSFAARTTTWLCASMPASCAPGSRRLVRPTHRGATPRPPGAAPDPRPLLGPRRSATAPRFPHAPHLPAAAQSPDPPRRRPGRGTGTREQPWEEAIEELCSKENDPKGDLRDRLDAWLEGERVPRGSETSLRASCDPAAATLPSGHPAEPRYSPAIPGRSPTHRRPARRGRAGVAARRTVREPGSNAVGTATGPIAGRALFPAQQALPTANGQFMYFQHLAIICWRIVPWSLPEDPWVNEVCIELDATNMLVTNWVVARAGEFSTFMQLSFGLPQLISQLKDQG